MADSTLNRFVAQFADDTARIAFTPTPPTPASGPDAGYFAYQQSDGSVWSWDSNSSSWVNIGGGTGSDVSFNTVAIGIASPPEASAKLEIKESGAPSVVPGSTTQVLIVQDDASGFGAQAGLSILNTNYDTDTYAGWTVYQEASGNGGLGIDSETAGFYYDQATGELQIYGVSIGFHFGPMVQDQHNTEQAFTLTTPDTNDVAYDTTPLAAIYINGPGSPSTRNFVSGIWVVTEGNASDKGRGIAVQNLGASDSFYAQQDATGGTGYAALNNDAGTGVVTENRHASAVGGIFRQGTGGGASVVAKFEGNIAGTAELINVSSDQTGKSGIVVRASGAANKAITVYNVTPAVAYEVGADDGHIFTRTYQDMLEMTAPAAPSANTGRLYCEDSGGKTRLMIRFPSGAAQQIAIEP